MSRNPRRKLRRLNPFEKNPVYQYANPYNHTIMAVRNICILIPDDEYDEAMAHMELKRLITGGTDPFKPTSHWLDSSIADPWYQQYLNGTWTADAEL